MFLASPPSRAVRTTMFIYVFSDNILYRDYISEASRVTLAAYPALLRAFPGVFSQAVAIFTNADHWVPISRGYEFRLLYRLLYNE